MTDFVCMYWFFFANFGSQCADDSVRSREGCSNLSWVWMSGPKFRPPSCCKPETLDTRLICILLSASHDVLLTKEWYGFPTVNKFIKAFKGVLHPWALFLKTLCIFSKNKATLDKVSHGSGQKCSKELKNHSFTSVETTVVKLQWKMCENQYFPCFEP